MIIHSKDVHIKAFSLAPNIVSLAPLIILSTDIPENEFSSRSITHKLSDVNEETRISQEIVLGIGGVKVLEEIKQ